MKKFSIAFLLFIISNTNTFAQISSTQVDELVNRTLTAFNVPGIAVAIVKDGKIVLAKGYGVKSILTKEKVDANTLFGIASNSKAFTSAALAILVDEGKIKWDDKVICFILIVEKLQSAKVTKVLLLICIMIFVRFRK